MTSTHPVTVLALDTTEALGAHVYDDWAQQVLGNAAAENEEVWTRGLIVEALLLTATLAEVEVCQDYLKHLSAVRSFLARAAPMIAEAKKGVSVTTGGKVPGELEPRAALILYLGLKEIRRHRRLELLPVVRAFLSAFELFGYAVIRHGRRLNDDGWETSRLTDGGREVTQK